MRFVLALALATILGSITFGIPPQAPAPAGRQSYAVEWVQPKKNVLGEGVELDRAEIALTPPEVDLRSGQLRTGEKLEAIPTLSAVVDFDKPHVDLDDFLADKAAGKYRIWVRVYDKRGSVSDWGGPDEFDFPGGPKAPGAPKAVAAPVAAAVAAPAEGKKADEPTPPSEIPPLTPPLPPTEETTPSASAPSAAAPPSPPPTSPPTEGTATSVSPPAPEAVTAPPSPPPTPEPPPSKPWKRHTPTGGCG